MLTTLLRFLRDGHQVICLIGDATVQIGDPSDKYAERPSIDVDTVEYNANKISATISSIFSNHYKYFWKRSEAADEQPIREPIIVRNANWYRELNVVEFFSRIGKVIRLSNLLSKKFVEQRAESHFGLQQIIIKSGGFIVTAGFHKVIRNLKYLSHLEVDPIYYELYDFLYEQLRKLWVHCHLRAFASEPVERPATIDSVCFQRHTVQDGFIFEYFNDHNYRF